MGVLSDWKLWVSIAVVIIGAFVIIRILRWFIDRTFEKASGRIITDETRYRFIKNAVSFLVWIFAFATIILMIPALRALAITLFAGAGILVAIIGFAAQSAFSNIIGGIFIIIFRPFRVGDMIKVGALDYGIVEDITLRHTIILNFENKRLVIPNSVISVENIINDNIEDNLICKFIEIRISYDSDFDLAEKIIQEEALKHPLCIDYRTRAEKKDKIPQVEVRLIKFDEYSINLRAYVWTKDPLLAYRMHSDINKSIKKRFDSEGVEIPVPYRTVVYKKDLPKNKKLNDK